MTNFHDATQWPKAFVWCRMGAESNQTVDVILREKQKDASATAGQFWYGFRSTHVKDTALASLRGAAGPQPLVALTGMRARAQTKDSNHPGAQYRFTHATTLGGKEVEMPDTVHVRARQRKSLALVCRELFWRPDPALPEYLPFTMSQLAAINGERMVNQNTTAFVKQCGVFASPREKQYELLALAELVWPYIVCLSGGEEITSGV